jgi:CBS-domain-containing membrane protein
MQPLRKLSDWPAGALGILICGFIAVALLGIVAMASGVPFLFPSIGPTALLLFSGPTAPTASPRNTLCGHAVGIVCGYFALWATGLTHAASAMAAGMDVSRIIAAALSLSLTGSLMTLLRVPHAPAGATTLIISLGIITSPRDLAVIELAVALLVLCALVVHRCFGTDYPWWRPRGESNGSKSSASDEGSA